MSETLDSQQVEIIGRGILIAHLLGAGIEVARPERDKGVDLIGYLDGGDRFVACPIQMKASTASSFSIRKHYEGIPGLLLVYVWRIMDPPRAEIYALTFPECLEIATGFGWTKTTSWTDKGRYVSNKPGPKVLSALEPFRMTRASWADRLRSASAGTPWPGGTALPADGGER